MKLNNLNIVALILLVFTLASCSLAVQENFEFEPEIDAEDPFADGTAWDFIQSSKKFNDDGSLNGEQFNYLAAAIMKADMVDEYNQTATTDRTYLLLNNNAFTGGGDVIQIITGSDTIGVDATPEETMERVDTPEKLEKLRKVLKYHIVETYIAQIPTLEVFEVWYLFQTMIPGDDGLIAFKRDNRWRITINRAPAPLPATALSQWENVRNHNYIFNNGIGHHLADPVRNQPY
jgi:hypothetical protein